MKFLLFALAASAADFTTHVQPILEKHCTSCHGATVQMGGLDLRTPEAMRKGGSKGAALVSGAAGKSLVYARIADQTMPPGAKKVPASEAAVIRQWIEAGATGEGNASQSAPKHWAFVAPRRSQPPRVRDAGFVRTPVDAFLLARMEANGIKPMREASKETLLRRVYLDLIGLPPSLEEQRAFAADPSPQAYDRVVEALLNRPEYGERWARHWLDLVRYAESNGYERDGAKPHAWRYRDWVIDAFNRDKPYDRFVTEQLAGDEVEGSNAETQIATTFLRLGTWDDEPAEPMLDRYDQLDDVLGVTSAALLGVTLRCARCHDHKFEPFTQKDYYRTLAVFQPLKRPQDDRKDLDRLVGTEAELAAYNKAKEKADGEVAERKQKIDRIRRDVMKRLFSAESKARRTQGLTWLDHAETVLAFATEAGRRTKEQKALVEKFNSQLDTAIEEEGTTDERSQMAQLKQEVAQIDAARPKEPPRAYIWVEEGASPVATRLLVRGDPARPGEEVEPGVPAVLGGLPEVKTTARSSGRRLALARWMTAAENPLTARVFVNRVWQWHFGEGMVPSENDFGVNGQRPANQELLDWLAVEFRESGWSMKQLHRLMVKSSAYRLSADWDESNAKKDAGGVLSWRWKPRRLEAEVVRDMTLAVSGRLNGQQSGPSIFPALPRAVLEGQSVPGSGWNTSNDEQSSRRSVYIFAKRSLAVPELELLDAPDTTSSCEQRTVSTTGPQALTFLNGDFTNAQARHLARRIGDKPASEQVRQAFRLALAREASDTELAAGVEYLSRRPLESFALVLLNANEYFYLN